MLLAAPFLQALLTVSAASLLRPVRAWILAGGIRNGLLAVVAVAASFEFLRTLIHG